MAIIDRLHNLLPKELGFEFWHLTIGFHLEIAVQTTSIDELHNQEDLLMGLESLVELGNIGVVKTLHDLHFSLN